VCLLVKCFEICERNPVPFCEVCLVGLGDVCGMVYRICERVRTPVCEVCDELFRESVRGV